MIVNNRTLSLLVDNTPGLLSRVAGLFTRRGYNIASITAGVTTDPRFTRITIVTEGDDDIIEQIVKQLRKLVDVIDIKVLEDATSVSRELVLVKVRVEENQRQGVISMADVFRGKIVDVGADSLIIELTDARMPASGRNPDIDKMGNGKFRLILLNKADLADLLIKER